MRIVTVIVVAGVAVTAWFGWQIFTYEPYVPGPCHLILTDEDAELCGLEDLGEKEIPPTSGNADQAIR